MTPTPTLQDLIDTVRASVPDEDPSAQLAKAAEVAGGLSQLGDRLLDHFVFQCRQAGMSWAELSASLGVSKQAAHKRFTGVAPTLQRYTVKAQQAVQNSIEQARALGKADTHAHGPVTEQVAFDAQPGGIPNHTELVRPRDRIAERRPPHEVELLVAHRRLSRLDHTRHARVESTQVEAGAG